MFLVTEYICYVPVEISSKSQLVQEICTSCSLYKQLVQDAICAGSLYELQLVLNLNLCMTYLYLRSLGHKNTRWELSPTSSGLIGLWFY